MKKTNLTNILSFGVIVILGVIILGVSTQAGYVPLEPSVAGDSFNGNYGNYFERIYQLGIAIAGVLAVLFIVIGGFRYMLSESFFDKSSAKNQITAAIGGLILALASWMILNTINPDLVRFDLSLPESTVRGSGSNTLVSKNKCSIELQACKSRINSNSLNIYSDCVNGSPILLDPNATVEQIREVTNVCESKRKEFITSEEASCVTTNKSCVD